MHSTLLDPSNALLTPAEMGRADALAAGAGVPGLQLMQAAGRAVARAAQRFGPCRTLVLCGPGNNGGDGWVAARMLHQMGWPVRVAALAPPRPGSNASAAAVGWRGPWGEPSAAEAARADLVIDAAYGAGLRGALPDAVAAVLAAARRVLAVDVPSGLDGATGQPLGRVRAADLTVTFFRLKPGHLLLPGRTLCGRVLLGDIGLPDAVLSGVVPQAWRNTPGLWRLPGPGADSHKYTRGHVTVLGGAAMTGAARRGWRQARRAGPEQGWCRSPPWGTATSTGAETPAWWLPTHPWPSCCRTPVAPYGFAVPVWAWTPPAPRCRPCWPPVARSSPMPTRWAPMPVSPGHCAAAPS